MTTRFTGNRHFPIRHAALTDCYPELVADEAADLQLWYASCLQTYLERDIRTIYNIGDLRDFQRFVRLLAVFPLFYRQK